MPLHSIITPTPLPFIVTPHKPIVTLQKTSTIPQPSITQYQKPNVKYCPSIASPRNSYVNPHKTTASLHSTTVTPIKTSPPALVSPPMRSSCQMRITFCFFHSDFSTTKFAIHRLLVFRTLTAPLLVFFTNNFSPASHFMCGWYLSEAAPTTNSIRYRPCPTLN